MSHPNSNLNRGVFPLWAAWFVSNKSGVWSEISLVKASTVDSGNFCSQSVLTRILSSRLKVGHSAELAHVNFLPDNSSSLGFKDSIQALRESSSLLCAKSTRQRPKNTRQSTHGIQLLAKRSFVVCLMSGTRQRGCRVHFLTPGKKIIANKKRNPALPSRPALPPSRPGHAGHPSELAPLPPLARPLLLV